MPPPCHAGIYDISPLKGLDNGGERMIVYSHRVQAILKQSVVELGLTMVLSDRDGGVALDKNEQVFADAARMLSIECERIDEGGYSTMVFRRR